MDLRIEKTKKSIINAFIELRSRKPLEKITVKELCTKASINKSTFYSHYPDLYALSDTLETEIVSSVIQSFDHPGLLFEDPATFVRELFLGYLSQDHLIQILFSGSRSNQLLTKIEHRIKTMIFEEHPEYQNDPVKNVAISYSIFGCYYAFMENRHYGEERVITLLGDISGYAVNLLKSSSLSAQSFIQNT